MLLFLVTSPGVNKVFLKSIQCRLVDSKLWSRAALLMAEQWDGCEARRWRFAGIAKKKCVSLLQAIPSGSTLKRYVSLIQHWFWTYGIFFQFQLSMCVCLPLQVPLFGLVEGKAPNCWGGGVPQSGEFCAKPTWLKRLVQGMEKLEGSGGF